MIRLAPVSKCRKFLGFSILCSTIGNSKIANTSNYVDVEFPFYSEEAGELVIIYTQSLKREERIGRLLHQQAKNHFPLQCTMHMPHSIKTILAGTRNAEEPSTDQLTSLPLVILPGCCKLFQSLLLAHVIKELHSNTVFSTRAQILCIDDSC